MFTRTYGTPGPTVIVLHGGPGAPGSAAALARGLADTFRVLEPWQRGSGDDPLAVARHVADLHELVESLGGIRPALVGHSWGAMLALAYAAEYPDHAGPLVLVGCGTFEKAARARMQAILDDRMDDDTRQRMERLDEEFPDPDERLRAKFELIKSLYDYDTVPEEEGRVDLRANQETWADMVRLQEAGVYPAAFRAITSPVLMLHGAWDPHPGRMIRDSLLPHIPQLEYREWDHCGHEPWRERDVREEFLRVLQDSLTRWLMQRQVRS